MSQHCKSDLLLGCIADDFTGATDAASFLTRGNMRTLLLTEVPTHVPPAIADNYDAIVIAQKTRTAPVDSAVAEAANAFTWLRSLGTKHFYFKYCSTFDSTPQGNIGPILDCLLEKIPQKFSIICPALPVNKRIVKNGRLLVDNIELHHTHMKDHPLTPMWDSDLCRLMEPQSKYRCFSLNHEALARSIDSIEEQINDYGKGEEHFYLAVDYFTDEHADKIIELFGDLPLLSGGSGLLEPWARHLMPHALAKTPSATSSAARYGGLLLAGSCSIITLEQISHFIAQGGLAKKIDPAALLAGTQDVSSLWQFVLANKDRPVLIYSSDTGDNVRRYQEAGKERVSAILESTMATLGRLAADANFAYLVVAGGETSGAVLQALNEYAYDIGDSLAPGVPIILPQHHAGFKLALKSGNFGAPDFFTTTIAKLNS